MNFKDMLAKISSLSEATEKTKTGTKHTADAGGYGRKVDAAGDSDDEPKKKRGGQEKETGPKFDTPKGDIFGRTTGAVPKGKKGEQHTKMKDADKAEKKAEKAEKKKGLKEWMSIAENTMPGAQLNVKPMPGASQLVDQTGKVIATGPADKIKAMQASAAKGEVTLGHGGEEMNEEELDEIYVSNPSNIYDPYGDEASPEQHKAWQDEVDLYKTPGAHPGLGAMGMHRAQSVNDRLFKTLQKRGKDVQQIFTKEEDIGKHNNATTGFDALVRKLTPKYGVEVAKKIAGSQMQKIKEADLPVHDGDAGAGLGAGRSQATFEGRTKADNKAEKAGKKVTKDLEYDMDHKGKDDAKAEKAGKKVTKDIEYDEKKKVKEAKKPDSNKNGIPDYAEDGKGKNDLKKKKVKEGMEHRLKAAHHEGKAHALGKKGYNCNYDDMEESRMYHEGYKQGLDECYGQAPIVGYVGEENTTDVVDDMASYGARDEVTENVASGYSSDMQARIKIATPQQLAQMAQELAGGPAQYQSELNMLQQAQAELRGKIDEVSKGEWLKQQASKPGNTFKAFGQTFHDKDVSETEMAFESWDNQLNSLLEEYDTIQEGMTVSISKGQQGSPDSVSVTAQDGEADQLLSIIKQAGLGLFGGEDKPQIGYGVAQGGEEEVPGAGTEPQEAPGVVGDGDDMLALIKKMTGISSGSPEGVATSDFEDEEGSDSEEHTHDHADTDEEACESCGMQESDCGCDHEGQEKVDEVESEDQMTYQMAEDNPPDSGAEETAATDAEISADNAAASSHGGATNSNLEEEDELEESLANGADDTFETDIEFMTNVISGGLNGKKTTGQSTVPVVSSQASRLHSGSTTDIAEAITDWKALAGIK